tara:strand:+ start:539 stop:1390 length:852 start_codon:yes stop_codon:yes gene_type:complete
MSFINKRESVIQIELTPFGKIAMAKGKFKPQFYQFFDDEIAYDNRYAGGQDDINEAQTRIKEAVRLGTQYLARGLETSFDIETKQIEDGLASLFETLKISQDEEESERLLSFPLGNMNLATQSAPVFNLRSWNSKIFNQSVTYQTSSGTSELIPQLTMNLTHSVTKDSTNTRPTLGINYDSESMIPDFSSEEVIFLDNSKLIQKTEPMLISLEEKNVDYNRKNFDIEIYEVIETKNPTTGEVVKTNIKIEDIELIRKYFDIYIDDSVTEIPKRNTANKNFFSN